MRKIEREMIAAIKAGKSTKLDNTEVRQGDGVVEVLLHGHCIAMNTVATGWRFTLAGWNTPTTRSRVSALLETFGGPGRRGVYTKLGQAYVKRYAARVQDPQGGDTPIDNREWF